MSTPATLHISTGRIPDAFICSDAEPWAGAPFDAVRHLRCKKIGTRDGQRHNECRACGLRFWEEDHLSHSQIEQYRTCPAAWDAKENRGIYHPAGVPLLFGGAWGRTLERHLRGRSAGRDTDLQAVWAEEWAASCETKIDWRGELPETHEALGARMLAADDTRRILDGLEPHADAWGGMERYTELRVPGAPPTIGYVDLITNKRQLIDFKTAGRPWTPSQLAEKIQGLIYIASLKQERWEPELEFTYIVWVKRPPNAVQVLTKKYTAADLFAVMQTIGEMWAGVQHKAFAPRKNWLMCNQHSCGVWATCPIGGGNGR